MERRQGHRDSGYRYILAEMKSRFDTAAGPAGRWMWRSHKGPRDEVRQRTDQSILVSSQIETNYPRASRQASQRLGVCRPPREAAQTRLAEAQYDYKIAEVTLAYSAGGRSSWRSIRRCTRSLLDIAFATRRRRCGQMQGLFLHNEAAFPEPVGE